MTTRISCTYIADVSVDNEVLVLKPAVAQVSAGVWVYRREGALDEARLSCLTHAMGILGPSERKWRPWAMVGHRALQPDNRISRYMAMWKYLSKKGIRFSSSEGMEVLHECEDGLRFVGAVPVGLSELPAVSAAMMIENAALILIDQGQSRSVVSGVLADPCALTGDRPPFGLLDMVASNSAAVVAVYGEFDDPEIAVAVMGGRETLESLGVSPTMT